MIEGTPVAKCPLKGAFDIKNYVFLTDRQLIVKINGKDYQYDIDSISSVSFGKRMLLLPIVLGGLISSLSVLAYFNNIIHPWALLLFFISGILLLFYGFSGSPALILDQKNSQEHYLLQNKTPSLDHFIKFTNQYLMQRKMPYYYIILSEYEWEQAKQKGYIMISKPEKVYRTIPTTSKEVLLKLILDNPQVKIEYLPLKNNIELFPCVTKNIPLDAVSKV